MYRNAGRRVVLALLGLLMVIAPVFAGDRDGGDHDREDRDKGALFVMTNSADQRQGNKIVMYNRAPNGDLSLVGYFPTGQLDAGKPQRGSGPAPTAQIFNLATGRVLPLVVAAADGLGSSNSLILSEDNRCLFAVNAGDNTVTSFHVRRDGLRRESVVASGGVFPVSLTTYRNILYVLNAGDTGTLAGFRVHDCRLRPLKSGRDVVDLGEFTDSFLTPPPGEVLTTPAQVSFTPDGKLLVLSIKGRDAVVSEEGELQALPSGRMVVFPVTGAGRLDEPVETQFNFAEGTGGPFSFVFTNSRTLVVVHANSGTVASYTINPDNSLSLINAPLPVGPFAPCWIVKSRRFVYTASFGAPSGVREILGEDPGLPDLNGVIHGFGLSQHGKLNALPGVEVAYPPPGDPDVATGNHAIDMHVIGDSLYFVQPRTGMVGRLTIASNGSLSDLVNFGGLAPGLEPFPGFNPGINNFLERCFLQDPVLSPECQLGSAQGITGF